MKYITPPSISYKLKHFIRPISHVMNLRGILSIYLCCLSILVFAQSWSHTFDIIPEVGERGRGMAVTDDGMIYCTSALLCSDKDEIVGPNERCAITYAFELDGELVWSNLIDPLNINNWENILVENDSIYISAKIQSSSNTLVLTEYILDKHSGDSISILEFPQLFGTYTPIQGHVVFNDLIFIYGQACSYEGEIDCPGYIHIVDKKGNYIQHHEFRASRFNGIDKILTGANDQIYFLCSSTQATNETDDTYILKYNFDNNTSEVIYHLPVQRNYGGVVQFEITDYGIIVVDDRSDVDYPEDYGGDVSIVLRAISYEGDSLWTYSSVSTEYDYYYVHEILEMTTCANNDVLVCGQYLESTIHGVKHMAFIMRISPSGEELWTRLYPALDNNGKSIYNYLTCVKELPDGDLVAIGAMRQSGEFNSEEDFWIIKVGPDGCYGGNDCDVENINQFLTSTESEIDISDNNIMLYPNPTNGLLTIESSSPIKSVTIRNLAGQTFIKEDGSKLLSKTLSVDGLDSGIYSLEIIDKKGNVDFRLFVKS